MSVALEVQGISKSFKDAAGAVLPVLEAISFIVPKGAIVSLLGASGCGKSTLLRLLAGLESPDLGEISSNIQRPGKEVGFLQQGERLLPWCNATDNAALGLNLISGKQRAHQLQARSILAQVGLQDFSEHYPRQLSGGMAQRVLLARTLATKPRLLLLDEPLGQLDIVGRKQLATILQSYVKRQQAAAVLVTHSVEEAVFISDLVVTLSRRPATIADCFVLSPGITMPNARFLDRENSFEPVLNSLLRALDLNQKGGDDEKTA